MSSSIQMEASPMHASDFLIQRITSVLPSVLQLREVEAVSLQTQLASNGPESSSTCSNVAQT